jgi:hypothetical protein
MDFTQTDYPANEAPVRIVAADVDGNGAQDLIVANPGKEPIPQPATGNQISLLRNNGDGTFAAPTSFTTGLGPSVTAGDLDGDGDIDLATANSTDDTVSLLRNDGLGNFAAPINFAAGDRPVINAPADLDGDGDLDLVTSNTVTLALGGGGVYTGNTISILRNNGDGSFTAPETLTVGKGVNEGTAADLDKDGDLDVVTANEGENTLSVLTNNGNGTFAAPATLKVGPRPGSPIAADLDRDGDLDLATANFGSTNVSVLKNNGDGTYMPADVFAAKNRPGNLRAGDLDGDSDVDLIVQNSVRGDTGPGTGKTISILRNNGDATFAAPEALPVGNVPSGLALAELNGSGNLDLAVANRDNNNVSVFLSQASCPTVSETVDTLFTGGPSAVTTTNTYSGPVKIDITGVGQAAGISYSDSFYRFTDNGTEIVPVAANEFGLYVNGVPAQSLFPSSQALPSYNPDHSYSFIINAPSGPLILGVGDTFTVDNTGFYRITISGLSGNCDAISPPANPSPEILPPVNGEF